jgi:hypothetical protein
MKIKDIVILMLTIFLISAIWSCTPIVLREIHYQNVTPSCEYAPIYIIPPTVYRDTCQ